MAKKKDNTKREIPEYKIKIVKELVNLIDSKNTILIASIKGLPTKNFQQIKKSLSNEAEIRIVKKRALINAIDNSKKQGVKELKNFIKEDIAVIFCDTDTFMLSEKLSKNKSPVKAKIGQIADKDIEVEAGPTDIPAGPAVSELGSLGISVQVKGGKIEIMQSKVIVQKGKQINESAVSVMAKLNILPFSVGLIPLVSYDSKSNQIFQNIEIDKEGTINEMKQMFSKSKSFAVNIGYICKETISLLISKAKSYENAIDNLLNSNINQNTLEEQI